MLILCLLNPFYYEHESCFLCFQFLCTYFLTYLHVILCPYFNSVVFVAIVMFDSLTATYVGV